MSKVIEPEIAARVKAVMAEFHIVSNKAMGERCGATTSAVNNWRLGYNRPPAPKMKRLCEETGMTLDWLYCGLVGSMDPKLAKRLNRRAKDELKLPKKK